MKEEKDAAPIVAYKGFGPDWNCRGFQYAVGKSYEHKGKAVACESGFHACEYPLDVFVYYAPSGNKFAVVEQAGALSRHESDSKVASSKISIKCELDFAGLVKAAIEYTVSRCKPVDPESPAFNSGDRGAASNSGDRGAASNSGYSGAASNSGKAGIAADFSGCGKAKSSETGAIVCVSRDDDGNILHIRASKVGENGIKPDVFYTLDAAGEFVEA